ncbi:MAG: tRNA (adenosine(37)-N6)-threonylcarbamoyltransferase complex ATPase subunit type 1 TsaE [Geitlerinemataceae cyanobacterium]
MSSSVPVSLPLRDPDATRAFGIALGETLSAGTTLLLRGDLGAGKTSLTQGIGIGLGIADAIVSPTFTLIVEYDDGRIPLYHFDLYRLEPSGAAQLQPELYWEGVEFAPGLTAIEWAERLPYLPSGWIAIGLDYDGEGRIACCEATPGLQGELDSAIAKFQNPPLP